MLKDLAPEIFRKRLMMEGYFGRDVGESDVAAYLSGVAAHLGLRAYGEPAVFAPAAGMGRAENAGFDGFLPLIDSGVSVYVWSRPRFMSALIYTCADFDEADACAFTRSWFDIAGEMATAVF